MLRMTFKSELQNATNVDKGISVSSMPWSIICHARSDRIDGHPHRQQEDCTGMSNKYQAQVKVMKFLSPTTPTRVGTSCRKLPHPCLQNAEINQTQSHVVGFSTMQHANSGTVWIGWSVTRKHVEWEIEVCMPKAAHDFCRAMLPWFSLGLWRWMLLSDT